MNLSNRTFKDNRTGEVLKVIDSFENIAILENKTKIDARRLMDPNHFTEQVDPASFFNNQNAYDSLFEKIKTIPTDSIPDEKGEIRPNVSIDSSYRPPVEDESAVIYGSVEDEREELARKYGVNPNPAQEVSRQNEAFARILEDTPEAEEIPAPRPQYVQPEEESVQRIEIDRDEPKRVPAEAKIDPVVQMFKGIKRSVDFTLDIKLENKIPKIEFIELMEDSYERSLIEYLAEEFTNELVRNPAALRKSISDKIREMVYEKPKVAARKPAPKKAAKPKEAARPASKRPAAKKIAEEPAVEIKPATPKRTRAKKEAEQQ